MLEANDIRERLISLMAEDFPEATYEQSFAEMGADSLDIAQLMHDVDDEFDVDIPQSSFRYFNSLKDIGGWLAVQG